MHGLLEAENEIQALKELYARGATDGLPVVLPTPERVEAMTERADLDPDLLLGVMGPAQGAATTRGVAVDSPQTFIVEHTGNATHDATRILRAIASIMTGAGSLNVYAGGRGTFVVMLNPEHAGMVAKAGFSRATIAPEVMRLAVLPRAQAEYLHGPTGCYDPRDTGDALPAMRDVDQLLLFVAGGHGVYSAVFPAWGFQPHHGAAVSEPFEVFPTCEMPFGH